MIAEWVAKRFSLGDVFALGLMLGVVGTSSAAHAIRGGYEKAYTIAAVGLVIVVAFALVYVSMNAARDRENVVAEVDWQ